MRRLHEEKLGIGREMPDRLAQEVAERGVVGVEHDDDRAGGVLQAVVEVAGLGVLVARAGEVARAEVVAQRAQRRAARRAAAAFSRFSSLHFWSVPPSSSSHTVSFSQG